MDTQAISPTPVATFGLRPASFQKKHADLENGWRNFQNHQGILGKLPGREFWGKLVDFP
jgi:hypothetical protein